MKSFVPCVLLCAALVHPTPARCEDENRKTDRAAEKRQPQPKELHAAQPERKPQLREQQHVQQATPPGRQLQRQELPVQQQAQPGRRLQRREHGQEQAEPGRGAEQREQHVVQQRPQDRGQPRHVERSVLSMTDAHSALQQANAARASLHGVNSRPIPPGEVTRFGNGKLMVRAAGGRDLTLRPNGTLAAFHHGDTHAAFRPDGRVRELHRPGFDEVRGPRGERTIMVHRPDHSVVVSMGPRGGYVQRPVTYGGREYLRRSYLVGGVRYQRVYSTYRYRDVVIASYVPRYYYAPRYYGWVYYPWRRPAVYTWGWSGDPWYGRDQSYFVASVSYAAPSYWLVDFFLAETLRAAFQAQAVADAQDEEEFDPDEMVRAEQTTPLSPELKREIAAQVRDQLARENKAAQDPRHPVALTGIEAALVPGRIFVVDSGLNVETLDELSCHVSPGTALRLAEVPPEGAAAVLSVASSREGDCPGGAQVTVSLAYLAEMHNAFRAHLDGGMQALHAEQGTPGLPRAPADAIEPPPRPSVDLPQGEDDVEQSLSDAQREAEGGERDIEDAASNLD